MIKQKHKEILAVVLEYHEEGWTDRAIRCVEADDLDYVVISRDGIGSMSKAFNEAIKKGVEEYSYIWFVTNIVFDQGTSLSLLECFDPKTAAVHPRFDSDHPHIRFTRDVDEVPFIEWTAPMISRRALDKIGLLDEQLPYWGMDLDWSYRAKETGYTLKVDGRVKVDHVYLRDHAPEAVSHHRRMERGRYDVSTENRLKQKYGVDWLKALWPTHHYVAKGRNQLYV